MDRRFYGGLAAGTMVLGACAVLVWCFQHGLFDLSTRAGSLFLTVFPIIMAVWAVLAVVAVFAVRKIGST